MFKQKIVEAGSAQNEVAEKI